MSISFIELEDQRRKWKPEFVKVGPNRFQGENLEQVILKSIALGMQLELPVAEWITETRKKIKGEVPKEGILTMMRNIQDEGVHYRAFAHAQSAYPASLSYEPEARNIYRAWDSLNIHPLWIATIAETGIFLCNLAVLRICGSDSISTLSGNISRDEFRHVLTNRAILKMLGYDLHNPPKELDNLRKETIDWLFRGLSVPALDIDEEFLMEQSDLLTYEGNAPELSELTAHADYQPPFERSNNLLY